MTPTNLTSALIAFLLSLTASAFAQIPPSAPAKSTTPGTAVDPNPVLVRGKNIEIRVSDFDLEKKNAPADQRAELFTDINRVQRALERMTINRLLLEEARKTGFDKQPDVLAELEYQRQMKLAAMYTNHVSNAVPVPDLEPALRERYKLDASKYELPTRVRVSHILIATGSKNRSKEDARKIAEEVRAKAIAGEKFTDLVNKYSDDPSIRRNNGDLGWISQEQVVPAFGQAAFAMKTSGEISPVVETEYGYHIIRYDSRKEKHIPPFEDLRESFLEDAMRDFKAAHLRNYLGELMAKEAPEANMDEVNKLMINPRSEAMKGINEKIQKEIRDAAAARKKTP